MLNGWNLQLLAVSSRWQGSPPGIMGAVLRTGKMPAETKVICWHEQVYFMEDRTPSAINSPQVNCAKDCKSHQLHPQKVSTWLVGSCYSFRSRVFELEADTLQTLVADTPGFVGTSLRIQFEDILRLELSFSAISLVARVSHHLSKRW